MLLIELSSKQRIMLGMLEAYTGCTLVPANTTDETPAYPYISFSVINLSTRKGTYSVHTGTKEVDGQQIPVDFKTMPASAKYSFTVQAKDDAEALMIAMQVKDFFEEERRQELADNEIIVADVGGITPRDNLLTMEYEYRKGLDVTISLCNVIEDSSDETIDTVIIGDRVISLKEETDDEGGDDNTNDNNVHSELVLSAANELLCDIVGYEYYKVNDEPAIGGYAAITCNTGEPLCLPILIAETKEAAAYTRSDINADWWKDTDEVISVVYNGTTYYSFYGLGIFYEYGSTRGSALRLNDIPEIAQNNILPTQEELIIATLDYYNGYIS